MFEFLDEIFRNFKDSQHFHLNLKTKKLLKQTGDGLELSQVNELNKASLRAICVIE